MAHREVEETFMDQVDELRKKFSNNFKDNIQKNVYDQRDLDRFQLEDLYACCFLRHQQGSIDKACDMVDVSLRWRKELALNDLTEASFSVAMHESGAIFYHNHAKNGNPILHIMVAKHKKDTFPALTVRQFIAWHIDKEFLANPGKRIVVLIDMTDAGLTNVDIDLTKFEISCFTTYYPALLAYLLIFEMPWVLNAIWNVIKKLLNAEQQKFVLLVKKPQITQYIDRDQLLVHLGGSDTYKYSYVPVSENVCSTHSTHNRESDNESLVSSTEQSSSTSSNVLRKRVTFSGLRKSFTFDGFEAAELEDQALSHKTVNNVHHGSLADIRPANHLVFHVDLDKGDSLSHIQISNTSKQRLSFKVKTTSPDVYRVKPHTGFLAVGEQIDISILLPNEHRSGDTKDKFLVMLLMVRDDINENNLDLLSSMWKSISRDSKDYMEYRLICDKVHGSASTGTITAKPVIKSTITPFGNSSLEQKIEMMAVQQKELADQLKKIVLLLKLLIICIVVMMIICVLLKGF